MTPSQPPPDGRDAGWRAETDFALDPLLQDRWSPRAFDPDRPVSDVELGRLLEAMRWSPSFGNTQPWRVVVSRRSEPHHTEVLACLTERNQAWAVTAPLLLIAGYDDGSTERDRSGNLRRPLAHAAYDLGQAMAHLTVQAMSLGLFAHQMAGILPEQVIARLDWPEHVRPFVAAAVGAAGDGSAIAPELADRKIRERQRRELSTFAFSGHYGAPLDLRR